MPRRLIRGGWPGIQKRLRRVRQNREVVQGAASWRESAHYPGPGKLLRRVWGGLGSAGKLGANRLQEPVSTVPQATLSHSSGLPCQSLRRTNCRRERAAPGLQPACPVATTAGQDLWRRAAPRIWPVGVEQGGWPCESMLPPLPRR